MDIDDGFKARLRGAAVKADVVKRLRAALRRADDSTCDG